MDISLFTDPQPKALDSTIERAPAEAKFFRGAAHVSVALRKRPLNQKGFDFFKAHVFKAARCFSTGL